MNDSEKVGFYRLCEAMEIKNPDDWDAGMLMLNAATRIERLQQTLGGVEKVIKELEPVLRRMQKTTDMWLLDQITNL